MTDETTLCRDTVEKLGFDAAQAYYQGKAK